MKKASCKTCIFFHDDVTVSAHLFHDVAYGECRRRPAVPVLDEIAESKERAFPIMRIEDWCGEWRSEDGEVL